MVVDRLSDYPVLVWSVLVLVQVNRMLLVVFVVDVCRAQLVALRVYRLQVV